MRSSVGSEDVHLEAHRTDVAVTSDVKEVDAENVIIEAHRATVVVETGFSPKRSGRMSP